MDAFTHVQQLAKMLRNLDAWCATAEEHAKKKSFDPDVYVQSRLAPDQYPFVRQVQAACDAAKYLAAYLAGQKAPSHPDTEKTFAETRARIATCVAYLASLSAKDFDGWANRRVSPPWLHGSWLAAEDYLVQASLPNFYFHLVTAYAILRHNGVDLGKMGYIGALPLHAG
jgi:hypothetical protein